LQARQILPGEHSYGTPYAWAERIFSEDLPTLPLMMRLQIFATGPDLVGVRGNPLAPETWNIEAFRLEP